ncbi:unnamed protein product [Zymoseptoria tritici ST99CH_1A5]|uniref:ubiquitinyl hydrolase 1 n=1 Tax=Zymoseptoria tritici ST99CH_1A5 TaxID=1276529 RepID=A0A1Y6LZX4_ZYMTR|nr:unnamed protein product [Zymoseptoria tritici ST99CH_1A5]
MSSYDEAPVPALSEEELAELQKASASFEPEVKGPLVSHRQSTTAITTEYASADPVYQAKTALLPQKFSHYRTVRGDGACGWRAVAFGYFETLIHHGDSNRFAVEQARLTSMNNIMVQAGYNPMLFEDFFDETIDLLRQIGDAVSKGLDASEILIEKFNDAHLQMYIITHLRTLTAAWMKTREDEYAPWLIGNTVTQYCDSQVLPTYAEIDNIGLSALKDVLLSPADISLEVMYLDRSEGSEVTMHRFDPANGALPIGSVRLLYRPGHYDILYKPEDLPPPSPQQQPIATYLQYGSQTHQEPVYDLGVPDFLTMIPGISYANTTHWGGMPPGYGELPAASNFFANVPPQTCAGQSIPTPSITTPQPQQIHPQPGYAATPTPTQLVPPPTQLTHDLPIRNNSHTTLAHSDFQHQLGGGPGGPFRPSFWQFEPEFMQASSCVPYQTAIFRNSHFNTAHFLNPDFQPEQWDPEDEYATSASSGKSSRSKSGG